MTNFSINEVNSRLYWPRGGYWAPTGLGGRCSLVPPSGPDQDPAGPSLYQASALRVPGPTAGGFAARRCQEPPSEAGPTAGSGGVAAPGITHQVYPPGLQYPPSMHHRCTQYRHRARAADSQFEIAVGEPRGVEYRGKSGSQDWLYTVIQDMRVYTAV